jgi:hypothetical protein
LSSAADRAEVLKRIGIAQKVFSKAQWRDALAQSQRVNRSVGDVLVAQRVISAEQLRALDRAVSYRMGRNEDKELARVILDSSYADEAAVEAAMEQQKEIYNSSGKLARLCDLLLDRRALSESQHIAARKILDIAKATERPPTNPDDEASD